MEVAQHLLDEELGAAVGVGGAQREVLANRQLLRVAVDRRRGAEDHALHSRLGHCLAEGGRAADVVLVVREGLLNRLPHRLEPGEVHHRFDLVLGKDPPQPLPVADVDFGESRRPAADLRHPLQRHGGAVAQVVDHDDVVAGLEQFDHRVRADEAGAAGYQDFCHT